MKTITILMSTYNGAEYLDEQLYSIFKQTGLEDYQIRLLIRDDGSRDNTLCIVENWKDRLDITLIKGENKGARESFFELLNSAPQSDYYAFSDQDDIWYEDKLKKAVDSIQSKGSLYFSNLEYISEDREKLNAFFLPPEFKLTLKRELMCNPANGCSMLWDQAMQEILRRIPQNTFTMHDEFVCTVALLFGKVIYDPVPSMGYRIHSGNVTQSNSIGKKIKIWKSVWFGRESYSLAKRAAVLLEFDLKPEDRKTLEDIRYYKKGLNRFRLPFSYKCENRRIERSFRLRLIIGIL